MSRKSLSCVLAIAAGVLIVIMVLVSCSAPDPTGPASQARLQLSAAPQEIPADGASTSVITAYVLDPEGIAADGVPIFWTTSDGSLDTGSSTVAAGVAQTTLTSALYPVTAVVTAEVTLPTKLRNSVPVRFGEASSSGLTLTADPDRIPADGASQSIIRAVAKRSDGKPVPDGTIVYFATDVGSISPTEQPTTQGEAVVTLTSGTIPQTATVSAHSGEGSAAVHVEFYSVDVGSIELTASTYHPGNEEPVVLTAIVYSNTGARVGDGVVVQFSASWPDRINLDPTVTTTVGGMAVARLSCTGVSFHYPPDLVWDRATSGSVTSNKADVFMDCEDHTGTHTPTSVPTGTPVPTHTPVASPTKTPVSSRTPTPTGTPATTPTRTPTPTPTPTPI